MTTNTSSTTAKPSELILLGTGTSGSIPVVGCLTANPPICPTCTSPLPQNKRLNTSALFRIPSPTSPTAPPKNLLIDCGKTFYATALRWFPKYNIRKIDALILTHAHADAFFGLDDLRSWTLGGFVQPWVDVYCSQTTLDEVERTFPYLVNKAFATGGGDVAEFRWHVFDDTRPFIVTSCEDVQVTPLPVEHGYNWRSKSAYMSLGYRIGDYSYISDCNIIPPATAQLMQGSNVVVLDGLRWEPHASHFSIQQAREFVRDEFKEARRPRKTWLVGFSHQVEHVAATEECTAWSRKNGVDVAPGWDGQRIGIEGQVLE